MAQFKDLLVFGSIRTLDNMYAKQFVGKLVGAADSATKAEQDDLGQPIKSTYIKDITGDGTSDDVTFTFGDGTTKTFKTKDTKVTVVDNLESDSAEDALSANQGKVIDGRLKVVEDTVTVGTF